MNIIINTLKAKDSKGQEYLMYPKTLIKCVTNENGDNFEDIVKEFITEEIDNSLDDSLDTTSENGVRNKAVATAIDNINSSTYKKTDGSLVVITADDTTAPTDTTTLWVY